MSSPPHSQVPLSQTLSRLSMSSSERRPSKGAIMGEKPSRRSTGGSSSGRRPSIKFECVPLLPVCYVGGPLRRSLLRLQQTWRHGHVGCVVPKPRVWRQLTYRCCAAMPKVRTVRKLGTSVRWTHCHLCTVWPRLQRCLHWR